jgi:hypothetical protein
MPSRLLAFRYSSISFQDKAFAGVQAQKFYQEAPEQIREIAREIKKEKGAAREESKSLIKGGI